jgi:hypothetical protein
MKTLPNYVADHFARHPTDGTRYKVRPHLVCADGLMLSVQASAFHYCSPKADDAVGYTMVEVYMPAHLRSRLLGKRDTRGGVFPFVPVANVNRFVHRHGGVADADSDPYGMHEERRRHP